MRYGNPESAGKPLNYPEKRQPESGKAVGELWNEKCPK
jgi:hypothetical protein